MIPRTLHVIWVGDESKRPDNCIATWRQHNPGWTVRVWGNAELGSYGWVNSRHMHAMAARELNGVADLMRWEILYNEGGFVVTVGSAGRLEELKVRIVGKPHPDRIDRSNDGHAVQLKPRFQVHQLRRGFVDAAMRIDHGLIIGRGADIVDGDPVARDL